MGDGEWAGWGGWAVEVGKGAIGMVQQFISISIQLIKISVHTYTIKHIPTDSCFIFEMQ